MYFYKILYINCVIFQKINKKVDIWKIDSQKPKRYKSSKKKEKVRTYGLYILYKVLK